MSIVPDLDEEMDCLLLRLPEGTARMIRSIRSPAAAPYRIPAGMALIVGGVFGFLPILGFWMAPLGLALMAQDVPIIRRPTARLLAAVNRQLSRLD